MQQWPISKTLGEREEIETERKIEEERQTDKGKSKKQSAYVLRTAGPLRSSN